jgi:hypothetical protein
MGSHAGGLIEELVTKRTQNRKPTGQTEAEKEGEDGNGYVISKTFCVQQSSFLFVICYYSRF